LTILIYFCSRNYIFNLRGSSRKFGTQSQGFHRC